MSSSSQVPQNSISDHDIDEIIDAILEEEKKKKEEKEENESKLGCAAGGKGTHYTIGAVPTPRCH